VRTRSVGSQAWVYAHRLRAVNVPTLRAAWWTARSIRRLRDGLRTNGLEAELATPPPLPSSAVSGVTATARCMRATCLERSLLLQKWLLAHGQPHTLVIGVPAPGDKPFIAHAWLEGHDRADDGAAYAQLVRLDPR
jgi:Transglutaminase-like superfamily